jgi:tetratricopeptide (TPR) repeat protein
MAFDKNKAMLNAQKYVQKGQYEKAIREYARIAQEDPNDIKVRQKLGDLYAREEKNAEALVEYNYVAKYYSDDGFYLRAIAVYKQILKLDPTQININLKLAELYHKQNLIGDAIKQFQLIYSYYEKKGDTVKSLDILDKMADMAPENLTLRMKLADAYYRNGHADRSLDEYVKIGAQLKKENRTDDVVNLYEKLIKHHPQRVDMLTEVADIYLRLNKMDMADARIQMGLKVAPDDLKLLYFKSRILLSRGSEEEASEVLSKLLEINPEFIEAKEELARLYEKLGRRDLLGKLYTELMVYFRGKGEGEKANHFKALYDNLVSSVSEEMTGPGLTGELAEMGGGFDEAGIIEAEVVEVGDEDVVEAEVVEEIPAVEMGQMEEAVGVEEEDLDNEGRLLMLKIDTYVKYGQYKEAVTALEEYTKNNPQFITPRKRLGDIYLELSENVDDAERYRQLAAQEFADVSALHEGKGESVLAKEEMERALQLDPSITPQEVIEEFPVEEVEEFDVVVDEHTEMVEGTSDITFAPVNSADIPESIDTGEMGAESIEITVDESGLSEDIMDIGQESPLPIDAESESGLISMTPTDELLPDGEDYFDLRKELEEVVLDDDMHLESKGGAGLLGEDEHYSFEDVFDEFKKGVETQFGKEDYETHYNLGIAYREMGLLGDAIIEFNISANDPEKRIDSFIMLGVTHRDKGEAEESIDYFREALDTPQITDEERLALDYELALSYEVMGDMEQARSIFQRIYQDAPTFRDCEKKMRSLGSQTKKTGEKKSNDRPIAGKKKDKISFV